MAEGWGLLDDLHQMRHLRHHAANCGRIGPFNHLVKPRKSQTFNHQLMFHRTANGGAYPLQLELAAVIWFLLASHGYISSADLPRNAATSFLLFNFLNASKVAFITLCGLVVPMDFVSTF